MFAVLEIPRFPLVAARRLLPGTRGPAVLVESSARQSRVLMADTQALAAGISIGMTAPRALARCPGLHIIVASQAAEALARETLLHAAFQIAPRVEQSGAGAFLIDLQGRKKAEVIATAESMLTELHKQDLPASMGIAATPGIAGFAARSANFIEMVEDTATFLRSTPLAVAEVSAQLAAIFYHWGLKTLGDFAGLSRESLTHRFGREALSLWDACHGRDIRPLDIIELPADHREHLELDYAIETLEPLLFIIRRFLDSLCMRIGQQHLTANAIILVLHLDGDEDYTFNSKLPEPTQKAEILFHVIHAHLEQVKTDAPVVALTLELQTERAQAQQRGLFDTALKVPAQFVDTLDRLGGIVGSDNVGTPSLENTHAPDSIRMVALSQIISTPVHAPPHLRIGGLPLRRYRPPLPAQVRYSGGRPIHIHHTDHTGIVIACSGPFYTSGDWWEVKNNWQREEWDIELPEGVLLRLFQQNNNWFIDGRYE